jgi:hypothetical protein
MFRICQEKRDQGCGLISSLLLRYFGGGISVPISRNKYIKPYYSEQHVKINRKQTDYARKKTLGCGRVFFQTFLGEIMISLLANYFITK